MKQLVQYIFTLLFVVCNLAFADVGGVAVPSADARKWANSKGSELLQTLALSDPAVKFAKLDKMMTEDVSLDYISQFVIGKYARLMDETQKKKYKDLFDRYVLSLYKKKNFNFNANAIHFSIDNVNEFPKFTNVVCSVDPGKISDNIKIEKIPVKFKLIKGKNNRIQAVDVEISDVSMVIEYRKRFYQMIVSEDENMEWFLDKFEDIVKANEASMYIEPAH